MEELNSFESVFPPSLVSLTPFTPSASASRRLSSCFTEPSKPVRVKRQLAWVNLQGRLVGAEEASAAKTIDADGDVLTPEAAVAWELFTPIQRVLLVAVVSAAAAHSRKNQQIFKLQKSIQLRDKVLQSMEQKLESLCQQANDQPEVVASIPFHVCKSCQCQNVSPNHFLDNTLGKGSREDDLFKQNAVEPEERRMSCLSDWAPSVASSADIQLDTGSIDDDMNLLQKECEEKDVNIQKLQSFIQFSEASASKRVTELEDIIRRKNTIIKKLRKDILILEQKVMNLTRLGRRSSAPVSSSSVSQIPFMADNMLYDMDSTTSPSSSDSDSPPRNQVQGSTVASCKTSVLKIAENETKTTKQPLQVVRSPLKERSASPSSSDSDSPPRSQVQASAVASCKTSVQKIAESETTTTKQQRQMVRVNSPLKEMSLNQMPHSAPPRLKPREGSTGESRIQRRRPIAPKRWI